MYCLSLSTLQFQSITLPQNKLMPALVIPCSLACSHQYNASIHVFLLSFLITSKSIMLPCTSFQHSFSYQFTFDWCSICFIHLNTVFIPYQLCFVLYQQNCYIYAKMIQICLYKTLRIHTNRDGCCARCTDWRQVLLTL